MANNHSTDTFSELRHNHFDGSDQFMTSHQIIKIRQSNRKPPRWAKSDETVRLILLRSFPKMATDARQRLRAGRWARVIHLYFRMNLSSARIAKEMNTKVGNIKQLIVGISRVARGVRFDNRANLGIRGVGRPRKIHIPIGTTLGSLSGSVHVRFAGSPLYRTDQSRRRAFRATSA